MTQYTINAQDSETSGLKIDDRRTELLKQQWNRSKSEVLASDEGLSLSDEHWAVILYLRKHYLEQGTPRNARTLSHSLNQRFSAQGGNRYLYHLFAGGPVTQGSRLACLRTPANATDLSFGTSY